jgi:hypothetical protein
MMRDVRQIFGRFLALLAIMAQLTLAAAVPASTISLADVTVICQHDGDAGPPPAHQTPAHPTLDCLLCVFCHGIGGPVGLVAAPPMPPMPAIAWIARAVVLPPSTAPPSRIGLAARPRGPPIPA